MRNACCTRTRICTGMYLLLDQPAPKHSMRIPPYARLSENAGSCWGQHDTTRGRSSRNTQESLRIIRGNDPCQQHSRVPIELEAIAETVAVPGRHHHHRASRNHEHNYAISCTACQFLPASSQIDPLSSHGIVDNRPQRCSRAAVQGVPVCKEEPRGVVCHQVSTTSLLNVCPEVPSDHQPISLHVPPHCNLFDFRAQSQAEIRSDAAKDLVKKVFAHRMSLIALPQCRAVACMTCLLHVLKQMPPWQASLSTAIATLAPSAAWAEEV